MTAKAKKDFGWPQVEGNYVKICQSNYPEFMASKEIGGPDQGLRWSFQGNTWLLYCDGSANNLLAGAIAVAGVTFTL